MHDRPFSTLTKEVQNSSSYISSGSSSSWSTGTSSIARGIVMKS